MKTLQHSTWECSQYLNTHLNDDIPRNLYKKIKILSLNSAQIYLKPFVCRWLVYCISWRVAHDRQFDETLCNLLNVPNDTYTCDFYFAYIIAIVRHTKLMKNDFRFSLLPTSLLTGRETQLVSSFVRGSYSWASSSLELKLKNNTKNLIKSSFLETKKAGIKYLSIKYFADDSCVN